MTLSAWWKERLTRFQLWYALRPLGVGRMASFAITAATHRCLLDVDGLRERLQTIVTGLNPKQH